MSIPERVFVPAPGADPAKRREDCTEALRCLRWDSEGDRRLRAMWPSSWPMLIATLEERAGLPLLARRLRRARLTPPPEIAATLRANSFAIAVRNLQSGMTLDRVISAAGRPALLLKGIDLADRLYGNPGHRSMGDVDFLVAEADAMAYHTHLLGEGFIARQSPDALTRSVDWQRHVYYDAPPNPAQLPFELHWLLADGKDGAIIDMAGIWHRSQPHATFGELARVMAPDDLFLYLCLHLRSHAFETPMTNLWDIAELLENSALSLDWNVIWQRAGEWRLTKAVRIALYMVSDTLGVSTRHLCDWTPDGPLQTLLPDGLALLGRHSTAMPVAGARLGLLLSSTSTWKMRAQALARGVLPTRVEIRLRYGHADQGILGDLRSYGTRLRAIGRGKAGVIASWSRGKGDLRKTVDRITRLRAYLNRREDS